MQTEAVIKLMKSVRNALSLFITDVENLQAADIAANKEHVKVVTVADPTLVKPSLPEGAIVSPPCGDPFERSETTSIMPPPPPAHAAPVPAAPAAPPPAAIQPVTREAIAEKIKGLCKGGDAKGVSTVSNAFNQLGVPSLVSVSDDKLPQLAQLLGVV